MTGYWDSDLRLTGWLAAAIAALVAALVVLGADLDDTEQRSPLPAPSVYQHPTTP